MNKQHRQQINIQSVSVCLSEYVYRKSVDVGQILFAFQASHWTRIDSSILIFWIRLVIYSPAVLNYQFNEQFIVFTEKNIKFVEKLRRLLASITAERAKLVFADKTSWKMEMETVWDSMRVDCTRKWLAECVSFSLSNHRYAMTFTLQMANSFTVESVLE